MQEITAQNYKRIVTFAYTIDAGDTDTVGYATISNTGNLGEFTGSTSAGLSASTYDLDVTVDGGSVNQLSITISGGEDWDAVAGLLESALQTATSSTETVAVVDGKIKFTSATEGASSSMLIAAGTAGSGGGDLLTAIDALGADYNTNLDTPVDGTEGQIEIPLKATSDAENYSGFLITSLTVKDSSNVEKAGLKSYYSSGSVFVEDDGSTTELAANDTVTFQGFWYV